MQKVQILNEININTTLSTNNKLQFDEYINSIGQEKKLGFIEIFLS